MTEQQIVVTLATKVMGWERVWTNHWKGDGVYLPVSDWNPLHNIADAWQVVEKIKSEGYPITIQNFDDYWLCEIGNYKPILTKEITVQEAICNAVIKAFA